MMLVTHNPYTLSLITGASFSSEWIPIFTFIYSLLSSIGKRNNKIGADGTKDLYLGISKY